MTSVSPRLEALAGSPERFPGALLLTGPSEAALDRESLRLAARLLCPGDDPDAACGGCRRVFAGLHPDLLTIEPEGVQIRVDRVREALAFGAGRPYEAPRRVVRIRRAELLGTEAANALLKALEEPGARLRWILTTTRPQSESLLATIRSRCAAAGVLAAPRDEREAAWRERGLSDADAADLVVFGCPEDGDPAARLEESRAFRAAAVEALEEGLVHGRRAALVLLADACASLPAEDARLLAELLGDAALAEASPGSDAIRHRAVAGRLAQIARRVRPAALRDACIAASDPPPDNRRGNRRLHFEKVLLDLFDGRVSSK